MLKFSCCKESKISKIFNISQIISEFLLLVHLVSFQTKLLFFLAFLPVCSSLRVSACLFLHVSSSLCVRVCVRREVILSVCLPTG